jgi:hypothetical protein
MSIRLKRAVTAARLAANRRSALKSAGPRTATGKRRPSLNAMPTGRRSSTEKLFGEVLMTAPVGEVLQTAERLITREQRSHPNIDERLQYFLSPQDIKDEIRRLKALRLDANSKNIRSNPKTSLLSTGFPNEPIIQLILNSLCHLTHHLIDVQWFSLVSWSSASARLRIPPRPILVSR